MKPWQNRLTLVLLVVPITIMLIFAHIGEFFTEFAEVIRQWMDAFSEGKL